MAFCARPWGRIGLTLRVHSTFTTLIYRRENRLSESDSRSMKFDRTPFMILTMARCGSYHLKSLLDSAPDIRCFGEVYKPNKVELPEKERQSLGLTKLDTLKRNQLGPDFLRRVVSTNSTQIVGIKAFLDHLGMAGCREMIFTEDWRSRSLCSFRGSAHDPTKFNKCCRVWVR